MKLLAFLPFLLLMQDSCKKTIAEVTTTGKVVHRSCATVAVQVTDPAFYHLGQDSWQQGPDKPVYNHVFSVGNICSFPAAIREGEEFTFTVISSDPTMSDCITCTLWDNPPKKVQLIKVKSEH